MLDGLADHLPLFADGGEDQRLALLVGGLDEQEPIAATADLDLERLLLAASHPYSLGVPGDRTRT